MKVLVIEDYAPLRDGLCQGLREEGFTVESAGNGTEGLWMAQHNEADVIVLDLMLPELDGLSLLRRLRKEDKHTPVLILTARGDVEDRITGLNLGADDYLAKPFSFKELLARTQALVRRRYDNRDPVIEVGPLRIDTATRKTSMGEKDVNLSPREYHLLELLARRAGTVVSRSEIWAHVYEFDAESESNVVDVYIGYLRRKLRLAGQASLIETVRGHGYMLRNDSPRGGRTT
ncbi:MAG: response regulator transcription factor [Planctomycetota bacterium]|nr:response regulator transcription factor [Planctomycetota bacterium]